MQPTFPSDHHFHRRARLPDAPRKPAYDLAWFSRHFLPALDPSDPRGA
jgi:hypothetical protein